MTKRLLAINDISCIGKCSITAMLPIVSSAGIECFILPTALLSTQTGGMKGYTYSDLTDEMKKIIAHWRTLGLKFDAICTGFLGSEEQIGFVSSIIDEFGKDALVIVDPVMGDFGNLYDTFEKDFPEKIKELCKKADIILPNCTEACFLQQKEYDSQLTIEKICRISKELGKIGPKYTVITGATSDKDKIGVVGYDQEGDVYFESFSKNIPGIFHGSGDLFASFLSALLLNGFAFNDAISNQVKLTQESVSRTHANNKDSRFGLDFEEEIPKLVNLIRGKK